MCSKNQEVDPLFAQFITKDFLIQRIFRVLRNSLFRTNDLYSKKGSNLWKKRFCSISSTFTPFFGWLRHFRIAFPRNPIHQYRSLLIHHSNIFWFAIRFLHAILFLLTEYDALLHLIDCQFINMEKSVTCFLQKNRTIYSRTWQAA